MKKLNRLLFGLHVFVGLGAIGGGLACILNPLKPLGVPADILKNSPFDSFLVPGIILFAVIGLGNVIAALAIHFGSKLQGYICSVFSWALILWIIVQCIMLRTVAAPHILYFLIGLVEAALSAIVLFQQQLFPTKLIIDIYKKVSRDI